MEAEPESCDDSAVECNTLLEAAEIAGSDERPLDIVIIPPSGKGAVSDEETVDDANLSPSLLAYLERWLNHLLFTFTFITKYPICQLGRLRGRLDGDM